MSGEEKDNIRAELARRELARRELARRHYGEYLAYTQGEGWIKTRMSEFLAARVQAFLEE